MVKIKNVISLLRPWQWYKNLVVFLALIFTSNLTNTKLIFITVLGLVAMCLVSSANYVINDIIDRRKDLFHPEKKKRPIASGKIGIKTGLIIATILMIVGLGTGLLIGIEFVAVILGLLVVTNLYSLFLKKEPIIDIVTISILFALRAVAGAVAIGVLVSPWLILCTMFVALFLASAKRTTELMQLGKKAVKHRDVYKKYSLRTSVQVTSMSAAMLLIGYSMYSFFSTFDWLIVTLPFAILTVLKFYQEVLEGSNIGISPEKALRKPVFVVLLGIWTISVLIVTYGL